MKYTVEPAPGVSDAQLLEALERLGAREVEHMAPGFVSAEVPPEAVGELAAIAALTEKAEKRPRQ